MSETEQALTEMLDVPAAPRVEIKILDDRLRGGKLPCFQTDMAAAVDLIACIDKTAFLEPMAPAIHISVGFALHIGDPHIAALVLPRSGHGHRKGLVLGNTVGLCDPDYQGPILLSVRNINAPFSGHLEIEPGERLAQLVFVPVVRPRFEVVEEFSVQTERAAGGFGSTGS